MTYKITNNLAFRQVIERYLSSSVTDKLVSELLYEQVVEEVDDNSSSHQFKIGEVVNYNDCEWFVTAVEENFQTNGVKCVDLLRQDGFATTVRADKICQLIQM